ncbi:MAG: large conductance mechanosensitive channel protein MscL [Candidatus Limivivens sp.]|nr:large conductance mechanosensitive channel protein MscL [Candidatus Limivivens sp.]
MKKFVGEFKEFIMRGNVMEMAIAFIISTAFNKIVTSLVNDVLMPVITLITGKIDFTNLFIAMDGNSYPTLEAAKEATSVFAYGSFIQTIIEFVIIAFSVFVVVKAMNRFHKPAPVEEAPATKICPYCKSEVPADAVKCAHCTSDLPVD